VTAHPLAWYDPRSYHARVAVVKRSFSLEPEVSDELTRVVGPGGGRASAFVNEALKRQLRLVRGLRAVERWESAHGALSAEQLAEADRLLDAAGIGGP
jgi:hypothetical protein